MPTPVIYLTTRSLEHLPPAEQHARWAADLEISAKEAGFPNYAALHAYFDARSKAQESGQLLLQDQ